MNHCIEILNPKELRSSDQEVCNSSDFFHVVRRKARKGKKSLFSTENDLKIEEGKKYFNAEIFPNIFSSFSFLF